MRSRLRAHRHRRIRRPASRRTRRAEGVRRHWRPVLFRDEGINIKVSTRLRFNKALMRENIQTKTNGGIVTLHGYVSTAEHSRLAAKRAAEVGGVRCVSNFIVVGPPPPQPAGNPY